VKALLVISTILLYYAEIADVFQKKFSDFSTSDDVDDTSDLADAVPWNCLADVDDWLFSVEDVDKAVFSKLKRSCYSSREC